MNSAKTTASPHYSSERAWLDHLRILAELPYPSWALLPSITAVARHHLAGEVFNFGWGETGGDFRPLGMWVTPVDEHVYRHFMSNVAALHEEMSPRAMFESGGRLMREATASDDFEHSLTYTDLLRHYGVRWGACVPLLFAEGTRLGFLSLYRSRHLGPYHEADQLRLDKVATALCDLDRQANPLASLPAAGVREAMTATLLLHRDGRILAQSPAARDMLFLARRTGMGPPEWTRPDWHALPPEVIAALEAMFAEPVASMRREHRQGLDWGRFDFVLEKMVVALGEAEPIVCVTIRHHEPLDIAVARELWGWPLSPQEKRILIASARNPGRAQLAEALGLAEGTLKEYISELQSRFGVASRQELIDRIVGGN